MIKFIYRFLINLLSFLLIQIPLQILGFLFLPILCCFYNIGQLPKLFRWFDSADPFVGRNTDTINLLNNNPEKTPYFIYSGYITRVIWLAFRNPINYFQYTYLGIKVTSPIVVTSLLGNSNVGNSTGNISGWYCTEGLIETNSIYEYYYIYAYSATRCFRFYMGYKIGSPASNPVNSYIQGVFTINPFASYSGIA